MCIELSFVLQIKLQKQHILAKFSAIEVSFFNPF